MNSLMRFTSIGRGTKRMAASTCSSVGLPRGNSTATEAQFPLEPAGAKSLNDYVNHPLRAKQARQFGPQIEKFLKERLPEHMVPASFVILDELPLLPNGKIDRRALPAPEAARPDLPHAFVAPRTRIEQSLAATWSDLLGLPQVGIHDNFFDLGGHSLLTTQLISRVRELFQMELPFRQVFQQPTIAALATAIEQAQNNSLPSEMPKIVPVRSRGATVGATREIKSVSESFGGVSFMTKATLNFFNAYSGRGSS